MGSLGAGAPPGGSGRGRFADDVTSALRRWQTLLDSPPRGIIAPTSLVAREASELAAAARQCGQVALAEQLRQIATLAEVEGGSKLAAVVIALARAFQSKDGPLEVAPPPLLDFDAPDVAARPSAPETPAGTLFHFRARWGRDKPARPPIAEPPGGAKEEGPLGLRSR